MRDDNSYIRTFTGRMFWPLDPLASDVDIRDIAHALAHKCRYGGHCTRFYSVAEHSIRMARFTWSGLAPTPELLKEKALLARACLLHDAGEAYLPDVPRPVKPLLTGFAQVEHQVEVAIAEALQVTYPWPSMVHVLDYGILTDEMRELLPYDDWDGEAHGGAPGSWRYGKPLGLNGSSFGWGPEYAESVFLEMYTKLTEAVGLGRLGL